VGSTWFDRHQVYLYTSERRNSSHRTSNGIHVNAGPMSRFPTPYQRTSSLTIIGALFGWSMVGKRGDGLKVISLVSGYPFSSIHIERISGGFTYHVRFCYNAYVEEDQVLRSNVYYKKGVGNSIDSRISGSKSVCICICISLCLFRCMPLSAFFCKS
jgi:hypothetical protein